MHGDGTRAAITTADMGQARLLDLTRSLRRAGRVATGVDRVERAYLDRFIKDDVPAFGLMRTAFGYVLLDKSGMRAFQDRLDARAAWGNADLLSRLPRRRNAVLKRAETDARQLCVARCLPSRLRHMLARQLPEGFDYFNVGHSSLTDRVLRSVQYASGKVHVMIHDVIPLEFPQFQRPDTVHPFRNKLRRVGQIADRVIYNSADTQKRAEQRMQAWGRVPPSIVSHLGTITPKPDADALPVGLPPDRPYFVTVGTIEPRKNHAFLLDLWAEMGAAAPPLLICGSRGWNNDAVFARLDALPDDSAVKEVANLSDGALFALMSGSAGTLFPTLAEGFGLPPIEALTVGSRVLCNDLPVLREILGQSATFAPVSEREIWLHTIKSWESSPSEAHSRYRFDGPTWDAHFKVVLRLT